LIDFDKSGVFKEDFVSGKMQKVTAGNDETDINIKQMGL